MNVVWQEALIHTKLYFRERQALFWNLIFPVFLLLLFCSIFGGTPERSTPLLAGVICINVMSAALFGTGVILVAARQQGILRRYKIAPVAPWKIIVGLITSRLLSISLTTTFLVVLARVLFSILLPDKWVPMIMVHSVGVLMFCAIALAIAGLARTVAEANGVTQIFFMPMMFLSGATFPFELMPAWMQRFAHFLPSTYYVAGLKSVMLIDEGILDNGINLIVMISVTIISIAIAGKFFKWE